MKKIDNDFILASYDNGIENYQQAAINIGLWASEQYVIDSYFDKKAATLDMGCGAGRTSFGMEALGFTDIIAFDLNPKMIEAAFTIAKSKQSQIKFGLGDATQLDFPDEQFDQALFSFNGIMTIPGSTNRQKAFDEAWRLLKDGGIFVFTAHDREKDPKYMEFWEKQKDLWEAGEQNPQLHEFGDILTPSSDLDSDTYLHIPNAREVEKYLNHAGFEVLEHFFRRDRFNESPEVKAFSGECEFWIVRKRTSRKK